MSYRCGNGESLVAVEEFSLAQTGLLIHFLGHRAGIHSDSLISGCNKSFEAKSAGGRAPRGNRSGAIRVGNDPWCFSNSGLISGTTRGTTRSILNAELLSITTQPCWREASANRDCLDPALKIAIFIFWMNRLLFPGLFRDFRKLAFVCLQNWRMRATWARNWKLFFREANYFLPAPVAPTIPIRYFFNEFGRFIFKLS